MGEQGAKRFDREKTKWMLNAWDAIREVAKVSTFGAKKYGSVSVADHQLLCEDLCRKLVSHVPRTVAVAITMRGADVGATTKSICAAAIRNTQNGNVRIVATGKSETLSAFENLLDNGIETQRDVSATLPPRDDIGYASSEPMNAKSKPFASCKGMPAGCAELPWPTSQQSISITIMKQDGSVESCAVDATTGSDTWATLYKAYVKRWPTCSTLLIADCEGTRNNSDHRNWEKGMLYSRMCDSMFRHWDAWWHGEDIDPESGLPHLSHMAWNALGVLAFELRGMGGKCVPHPDTGEMVPLDDRPCSPHTPSPLTTDPSELVEFAKPRDSWPSGPEW